MYRPLGENSKPRGAVLVFNWGAETRRTGRVGPDCREPVGIPIGSPFVWARSKFGFLYLFGTLSLTLVAGYNAFIQEPGYDY
jgi:hypothetical protein